MHYRKTELARPIYYCYPSMERENLHYQKSICSNIAPQTKTNCKQSESRIEIQSWHETLMIQSSLIISNNLKG